MNFVSSAHTDKGFRQGVKKLFKIVLLLHCALPPSFQKDIFGLQLFSDQINFPDNSDFLGDIKEGENKVAIPFGIKNPDKDVPVIFRFQGQRLLF